MLYYIIFFALFILILPLLFAPSTPLPFESLVKSVKLYREKFKNVAVPVYNSFEARDGEKIHYRHYKPIAPPKSICILVHGSSTNSLSMDILAKKLQDNDFEVYSLDIRGHGMSGRKGDIKYIGQLEDDLSDFIMFLDKHTTIAKLNLIGFSSGGGYCLRIAGNKELSKKFVKFIAISPMLSALSSTYRKDAGGWVSVSLPRILYLLALNYFKINIFNKLTVLKFALDAESAYLDNSTTAYSFTLQQNFGLELSYEKTIKRIEAETTILVGKDDSLFLAQNYEPEIKKLNPNIKIEMVDNADHIDMIYANEALDKLVKIMLS
ncbi:MAG: alpha/beta fold hydrolase [Thermonemataceae bacterium]|nr:alpha/beta fold hydrolase [Thermonemataceae bacterium]